MRIAICDDEKDARELLGEKVKRLYPEAELWLYSSGEELLLSDKKPDIVLLDIRMSGKNGMETARELRERDGRAVLIFVTALEDFVFQAFDVGAFHYLVKPFEDRKLSEVLGKAAKQFGDREKAYEEDRIRERASLVVNAGGKHITVNLEEIIYAEVFDRKIILHTTESDIEYYGKMKDLEKRAGDDFYRPHRSYLVNFHFVRKYDAATIWLKKGQVPMAKQNYREFVQHYLRYNQRKGRQ